MGGVCPEVGLQSGIRVSSSSNENSRLSLRQERSGTESGHSGPHPRYVVQGCDRRGLPSPFFSGLLQSSVCGPEEEWEMETCDRSLFPESLSSSEEIQDGDREIDLLTASSGGLDLLNRSHGCLFPYSNSSGFKEVSPDFLSGKGLPVQGPSLRYRSGSMALHKDHGLCEDGSGSRSDHSFSVPRRLAGGMLKQTDLLFPSQGSSVPLSFSGSDHQLSEVRSNSSTGVRLHRDPFQSSQRNDLPHGREHTEGPVDRSVLRRQNLPDSQSLAVPAGYPGIPGSLHSLGEVSPQVYPAVFSKSVETGPGVPGRSSSGSRQPDSRLCMVVHQTESDTGGSNGASGLHNQSLHRRVSVGVGSSLGRSTHPRKLVSFRDPPSHQCSRDEGSQTQSRAVFNSRSESDTGCHGQHVRGSLHQSTGRHKVDVPVERDKESPGNGNFSWLGSKSPSHSRPAECYCRPAQSQGSDSADRVVSSPGGCGLGFQSVGKTHSGSICNEDEFQAPILRFPSSGPTGVGHGRSVHGLDRSVGFCLPTDTDSGQGAPEVSADQSLQTDSGRSFLAQSELVPRVETPGFCRAGSTTDETGPSQAAQVEHLPQQPRGSKPSRLVAAERSLERSGFSEAVRNRVVAPQRKSTQMMYQSRWNIFCLWCEKQGFIPQDVSIPQVADFLLHLFQEKELSPKSIEGYRTAISSSLKFASEVNIGTDSRLSALIQSFFQERPKSASSQPPWDLSIVLNVLSGPLFEPIDDANKVPLQLLTWKTVFLVLLASGCRRGEVHALQSKGIVHDEKWKWITLFPLESFVSKTQLRTSGATALDYVTIKSLSSLLPSELARDRAMCPVRALKVYLSRTSSMRQGKRLLFISHKPGHSKDIHPNTISGWIRKLIQFAYANADSHTAKLAGTTTHTIRGLAASLAFRGASSMEDILKACSWKSHNTFTHHYLKEVSGLMDGLHKLGPLVVAQKVVSF